MRSIPSARRAANAFTLVEIIVVIGIIALLIALLMPSLSRAREQARRVQCMSNQRQLAHAWSMYTVNFNGYLPLAWPDGGTNTSSANYAIDKVFFPWVVGDKRESEARANTPTAQQTEDWLIRAGSLYRYLRSTAVYRCPEHNPRYGKNEINISYGINNFLNGEGAPLPKVVKLSHVRKPSTTYLTVDQIDFALWPKEEDERSGIVYADWTGFQLAPPGPRHRRGSCFSFVDGHTEYLKWQHDDIWGTFANHNSKLNTATYADADMKKLQAMRGY